jgi:hypothetical protein
MRKIAVALITASLFLVPVNAIAAVKAGDLCKNLGSTATANGKKYTCIKKGKKLAWNQGVATAKQKPNQPHEQQAEHKGQGGHHDDVESEVNCVFDFTNKSVTEYNHETGEDCGNNRVYRKSSPA